MAETEAQENALRAVRVANLRKLGLSARELSEIAKKKTGGRGGYSFWVGVLAGKRSFGEKLARSIEDDHGLDRGQLDEPDFSVAAAAMLFGDLRPFEIQLVTIYRLIGKAGGREAQEFALNEMSLILSRENAKLANPEASPADPFAKTRGTLFVERPEPPPDKPAARKPAKR